MSEYREIGKQIGWRALFALPFIAIVILGGRALPSRGDMDFNIGYSVCVILMCVGCIFISALIMARPLLRLFAEPWGSLFYPVEHFDKPQPMYGIPEARRKEGKYEEAIAGFEKIAAEDPQELRAYISMMDVAVLNLKDTARAEAMLQNGLAALAQRENREQLISAFQNISSRLVSSRDGVPESAPIPTDRMKRRPASFWK